jgi:pyruvate formate lyase activating enzyme
MKIAAWQKESFIDYEGKISTLVFTPKCNLNCGYCHNPELKNYNGELINEKEIFDYLISKKKWIDAVVISGGEPTKQQGLKKFAKKAKKMGLLVKLDTNGTNYSFLQELRDEKLIDYIAMDVKGPIELYPSIAGKKFINLRDIIAKGILVSSQFPDYEFRTTICPINDEKGKMRWMTPKEIGRTAELISDWASTENGIKYFLQAFKAVDKEEADKRFTKEGLSKEFYETPIDHLKECLIEAQKHLPNAKIRA